jgi:putative ABC transport system substrate-binding protein
LHELLPAATRISLLGYKRGPRSAPRAAAHRGPGAAWHSSYRENPGEAGELDGAYAASAAGGDQAILVQESSLTFENMPRVIALAAQYHLPAIYQRRDFVESGGLLSYAQVFRENYERAAALVDKILKGAKPADLPIEQPTRFELVVNLKTAAALGLTIPPSILARADEVIE